MIGHQPMWIREAEIRTSQEFYLDDYFAKFQNYYDEL